MKISFEGWERLTIKDKDDFFMDLEILLQNYGLHGLEEI